MSKKIKKRKAKKAVRRVPKAERLAKLEKLLKTGRRLSVERLAGTLKVTTRTIYPMISSLAAGGLPLARTLGKGDVTFFVTRRAK